ARLGGQRGDPLDLGGEPLLTGLPVVGQFGVQPYAQSGGPGRGERLAFGGLRCGPHLLGADPQLRGVDEALPARRVALGWDGRIDVVLGQAVAFAARDALVFDLGAAGARRLAVDDDRVEGAR